MGQILQRNAAMFTQPQAAPISLGQYGMPRLDMSQFNTVGGLGVANAQTPAPTQPATVGAPAQNFLAPNEWSAIGFGGIQGTPRIFNPFSSWPGMRI